MSGWGLWVGWESARKDHSNLRRALFPLRLQSSPNLWGKYGPPYMSVCLHIFTCSFSFPTCRPIYPPTSNNILILKSTGKLCPTLCPFSYSHRSLILFVKGLERVVFMPSFYDLIPHRNPLSKSESSLFHQYCLFSQPITSLTNPMALSLISLGLFNALAILSYFI